MGWVTDREIGWWEWKLHNLRYRAVKALVGRDRVVMNCASNEDGLIGGPPPGGRLFLHNVTVEIDGRRIDLEQTLAHA